MLLKNPMKSYLITEDAQLLKGGESYFETFKILICQARSVIHLQTYILENDQTGTEIINALIKAVKRGVKVYLIIDAFGSSDFDEERLTSSGIYFRWFSPVWSYNKFGVGRRLHHKVLVIDGKQAIVGGINIGDKYKGTNDITAWLDFAVLLKGPVVKGIEKICESIWHGKYFKGVKDNNTENTVSDLLNDSTRKIEEEYLVRIRQHDWARNKNEILQSYLQGIAYAKKKITIIASYFLPGRKIKNRLKAAKKRGVDIRILLTQQTDVKLVKYAENYLYKWLLQNDITIYEWQSSVLHGKAMIIDQNWCTIGSFNLNNTSIHGNVELNVDIINKYFAGKFENEIEKLIEDDCVLITTAEVIHRKTFMKKTIDLVSYILIRALLGISLFFVNREKNNITKYL